MAQCAGFPGLSRAKIYSLKKRKGGGRDHLPPPFFRSMNGTFYLSFWLRSRRTCAVGELHVPHQDVVHGNTAYSDSSRPRAVGVAVLGILKGQPNLVPGYIFGRELHRDVDRPDAVQVNRVARPDRHVREVVWIAAAR